MTIDQLSWYRSAWTRDEINRAASAINNLDETTGGLAEQIGRLFELDRRQGKEIERLHAVIGVLTDVVIESGAITRDALDTRIKAAIDEVDPPPSVDAEQAPKTTCRSCGTEVPVRSTYYTEVGEVCGGCFGRRG